MNQNNRLLLWLRINWFNLLIISVYTGLVCFCTYFHEPWRDEAQSWLIVRDLDFGGILRQMAYEGTPALWHILVLPLAKLGLPYYSQNILHLLIAIVSVSVLMFYAPFKKITKVLLVFSYYFIYEYAVIARNYNLTILLLFLIAALYKERFKKPVIYALLVFLLFNTNVHSLAAAGAIMLLFIWDAIKEKNFSAKFYFPILIMLSGGIAAFLQILPRSDSYFSGLMQFVFPDRFFAALGEAFFPWATTNADLLTIAASLSFYILLAFLIFYLSRPAKVFMILSLSWFFYIFTFKYPGFLRHCGLVIIFLIFAFWINKEHKVFNKAFSIVCYVILFSSCIYGFVMVWNDYKYPFSGSKDMADFIIQNNLENKIIVAYHAPEASALLPYLPGIKFWYPEFGNFDTFVHSNKTYFTNNNFSQKQVLERIESNFVDKKNIIILLNKPFDETQSQNYILLHNSTTKGFWPDNVDTENYWLYKYKLFY